MSIERGPKPVDCYGQPFATPWLVDSTGEDREDGSGEEGYVLNAAGMTEDFGDMAVLDVVVHRVNNWDALYDEVERLRRLK